MRKPTFWTVCPTKTQIRLCMKKLCNLGYPKCTQWRWWMTGIFGGCTCLKGMFSDVAHLILEMSVTTAATTIFVSYYFSKKISLDISCKLSCRQFLWNVESYFRWKILNKIFKISSAIILLGALRVKKDEAKWLDQIAEMGRQIYVSMFFIHIHSKHFSWAWLCKMH